MFDFAWTEIALIGVVALVAIGPKDLPVAIKTIACFVKKARKMASEFQGHVDEMVREANLHEVRDEFQKLRNFDIKSEIEKAVDSDGSIRSTLTQNPLHDPVVPPVLPEALPETEIASRPEHVIESPEAPSFVPPGSEPGPAETVVEAIAEPVPPAFVPPGTHLSA